MQITKQKNLLIFDKIIFVNFTRQSIIEKLKKKLPGVLAHQKMMGYNRIDAKMARETNQEFREGAVLILLFPQNNSLHTLLMLRPEYDGVHSAQVSFPGGKKDLEDKDLLQTALRELKEEVGVVLVSKNVIGQLTEIFIPPSKFLVTPFVAWTDSKPVFTPDTREVQELIEMPISILLDQNTLKQKEIFIPMLNKKMETNYFDIYGKVVWGATAMMLMELKDILADET